MAGLAEYYKETVPVNIRTFIETLTGNTDPITEKDFTAEDLEYLRRLYNTKKSANQAHEQGLISSKDKANSGEWLTKEVKDGVLVDTTAETLQEIDKKLKSYDSTRHKTSIKYGDYANMATDVNESDGWYSQLSSSFTDPGHRAVTTLGQFNVVEQPGGSAVIQDTYDWTHVPVNTQQAAEGLAASVGSPQTLGNAVMRIFKPNVSRSVNIKLPNSNSNNNQ